MELRMHVATPAEALLFLKTYCKNDATIVMSVTVAGKEAYTVLNALNTPAPVPAPKKP